MAFHRWLTFAHHKMLLIAPPAPDLLAAAIGLGLDVALTLEALKQLRGGSMGPVRL